MMFTNHWKFTMSLAFLAMCQPPACNTQYFQQPPNFPYGGSVSQARSTASQHQLGLGGLGISRGVVNAQTESESNGGYANGGTSSFGNSRSRTHGVNLGGLDIGSTLTSSNTRTNGEVSRGLSHGFNVGGLGFGSSLSKDNLNNGFGLQRSQEGGLQLGLGLLNFDLSRKQQQQQQQALTQAQAQAQGEDAFARSNSNAATQRRQFGGLGFSRTESQSDALSRTAHGQTSASAGGFGRNRRRRTAEDVLYNYSDAASTTFVRRKRRPQFIPFAYPVGEFDQTRREFGRFGVQRSDFGFPQLNYDFPFLQIHNANAQSSASSRTDNFEQQAGANSKSQQELNESGLFQNNGGANIGSNLPTDGSNEPLRSTGANQIDSLTNAGSQSSSSAQSQALNMEQNHQQAANANTGPQEIETEHGEHFEEQGDFEATNNKQFDTASNLFNKNDAGYENGDTVGSQADASSQAKSQGHNGQNPAPESNPHVNSVHEPDGLVSSTATSNASAVSESGGQSANAVASASSSSGFNGDNNFTNANDEAGSLRNFGDYSGSQANSAAAFANFGELLGFGNGQLGLGGFKIRQRKSSDFNTHPRRQQGNQTSTPTLEITNNATEINWLRNRVQLYNHYPQQHQQQLQQPQPEQQQHEQQQQQKHPQQLHYSSINLNSSTEQFAIIDENQRHGRTFTLITDLIRRFTQPSCIYPCTLDAYQQGRCCEATVIAPQPPTNVCCQQPLPPPPPPLVIRPPITIIRPSLPLPTLNFPLIPSQCCNFCPAYGFYGPPPCLRYTLPGAPGHVTLQMG